MKTIPSKSIPKLFHIINVNIIDPYHGKEFEGEILLKNGRIEGMGSKLEVNDEAVVFDAKGLTITHGFCDLHVHFREPGREDKETLFTGSNAALAGGFTRVCVMPNTEPPLDSPESIRFICEKGADLPIHIFPIGTITKNRSGKDLSELGSMVEAGAVAFSDDGNPIQDGGVLRRALEYATILGVPIINHAEDQTLKLRGQIHEGIWSTQLGLAGIPDVSESVMISRDVQIAGYVHGKLHIPHVTAYKSLKWIQMAKKEGWHVTSEVTPHHLTFTDEHLQTFNSNLKVAPPIRSEKDRRELVQALIEGVIDCISTDHAPHTIEEKESPFEWAPEGTIGLESAFGAIWKIMNQEQVSLLKTIQWLTDHPRKIMGFERDLYKKGTQAELVLINPSVSWRFDENHIYSKSRNSAFYGRDLYGQPVGVISKGKIYLIGQETFFDK